MKCNVIGPTWDKPLYVHFAWVQQGCFTNTGSALDPRNTIIQRLMHMLMSRAQLFKTNAVIS